jgi:acyl-CoA synthetase (AMP-forming)/AMP-acid ligase II
VADKLGAENSAFAGVATPNGWQVDLARACDWLARVSAESTSCLVLGTAFQFVELTDHCAEHGLKFTLPAGSRVMETGGYKGRTRELPKTELHERIADCLGIAPENIVCEYGMSELSSQAYDSEFTICDLRFTKSRRVFRFPPWVRVRIVSPETRHEVGDGETGLVQVFDLANVWSVAAVQTEDLGVRLGSGFELIGRTKLAEARGCSLMTA